MKKRTYILIIILIFLGLALATFFSFIYLEFGKPPAVKAHSYLEISLSGGVQEKIPSNLLMEMLGAKPELSMYDLWMNIRKAKADRRIQSLVLRLGYLQCDWAKVNEIREMIADFRKSGKKTYAYIEDAIEFDKEYYLSTACDEIIMHPLGSLVINGIGGYVPFVKKGLNKLGIKAEIEHVEEYKTAYNMFTEDRFTPAHKEMLESIYGDIFSHYIRTIANAKGRSEEEIRNLIDHGFFNSEQAQKTGLVDKLLFEDEFIQLIKGERTKIHKITHEQYLKIKPSSLGLNKGKKIALIYGTGAIHSGEGFYKTMGSSTIARWIRKAYKDKSIAAIVFRVDSPGGSAVASDIIYRESSLAKKEKPFVVSMSDMAGSGGYWVSMAAHKIIAQPQTLTGSIGVISGKFNMSKLYEKMGITAEKITFGKRADLFSTFRSFKPDEKSLLKNQLLWIYDKFLAGVSEGRNMSKEEVDKIARGRVWTGSQAKELGLVDELGGLREAINAAKELAGIPASEEVRLIVLPKKVTLFDVISRKKSIQTDLNIDAKWEKMIHVFKILERESTLALMPFWISPK